METIHNRPESGDRKLFGPALPREASAHWAFAVRQWSRYAANRQIVGQQDETGCRRFIVSGDVRIIIYSLSGKEVTFRDIRVGFESHAARANLRTRSMTEAA